MWIGFPILSIRSRLALLVLALVAVLVTPAGAAAATYVVNETGNVVPDVGCEDPQGECDLWDAINQSNASTGVKDTIEFEVEGNEVLVDTALPQVTDPVAIDGTDTNGDPGVVIRDAGGSTGLVLVTENSTVEGVALGGFFDGIDFKGSGNRICNSFVGTDLSGTVAEPNGVGIWIAPESVGTEIGGENCASGGNVISGNEMMGVWDDAEGTVVAGNLIGVGVGNTELPNGTAPNPSLPAGGVYASGTETTVGEIGEGNVIAYNKLSSIFAGGGGVISESFSVTIRGNSIYENEGPGIFFRLIGGPPSPTLESAVSTEGGATVVDGTVANEGTEAFTVDLHANAVCDEPETGVFAGEGETYLGSATATTTPTGGGEFSANLPVQPEGTIITATATRESDGATGEFSECLKAPSVTPKPPDPGPSPKTGPAPILFLAPPPAPENGETVVVAPKAGTVFVTLPNGKKEKLKEGQTIPVGAIVDATRGKVVLTSVNRKGETQTAVFFGGVFLVQQHEGSGLVILKLRGLLNCGKAARSGRVADHLQRGGSKSRKLWGSGKGNFRTEGNNGSATVRGTIWLTEDRCGGTFFKVKQGVVTIRDFGANETFPLGKGKSYLAEP